MRFRVLGPVEVAVGDGLVAVPRRRERCLLAILLLNLNRVVSVDQLADLLWESDPPERARRTVHSHVSRVKKLLSQATAVSATAVSHDVVLESAGAGYRLCADPDLVDVHRFRALSDHAGTAADPAARVAHRRAALDLWRGQPLEDAASTWLRNRLCADLEERRLSVTEELMADMLALGREQEILPELANMAGANPIRERLVELHMRALHRAGRKMEALQVYDRTREFLADELGLDPGPALRQTHREILQDQPLPGPPAAVTVAAAPGGAPAMPAQLPADVVGFTGRAEQLSCLDGWLEVAAEHPTAVVISALSGTAGVGKTALAVHWAHRVADQFPDGQLYVNLRGFDPAGEPVEPAAAVCSFLDALGVQPQRVPAGEQAQYALYRSVLAGRRMLVLLDNARDAEQVRPLLPGTGGVLVLITSRNRLTPLVATEGARPLSLDLLSIEEAREFLARRLGAGRVAAEPETVDDIIQGCARLPLALAIAAAHAAQSGLPLAALAADLHDTGRRLDTLDAGDPASQVRAVLSWSYTTLTRPAARLFRLLGVHPGPDISATAAASLAGCPPAQARPLLTEIARANLITEHEPGRYTWHDLLRAYATELAAQDPEPERRTALTRLLDHYTHTAHTADRLLSPARDPITLTPPLPGTTPDCPADHDQALAWFTAEHAVLLAAVDHAAATGFDTHTWQLAWALSEFLFRRGRWHDLATAQQAAVTAAGRLNEPAVQARAHRALARAHIRLRRFEDAHTQLRQALDLYRQAGDLAGQGHIHHSLAVMWGRQGCHTEALDHARQALDLFRAAGHRRGQARALNTVGWYNSLLGDHQQALAACQQALPLVQELGDRDGQAATWDSLGYANHHLGQHIQALACFHQALDLYRELGHRYYEANTLTQLGDAHHAVGDPHAARTAWQQALTILDELDHPDTDQLRTKLATAKPR